MDSDELTEMMDALLRPCPWCGGKAKFMHAPESWVQCSKCNARTGMRSYEINAVKDWNRMCPTDEQRVDTALDVAIRCISRVIGSDKFLASRYGDDAGDILKTLRDALKTNDWTKVDKAVEWATEDLEHTPRPKLMEEVRKGVA